MKTKTSCLRCQHADTCPAYDARMLYGFCQGFKNKIEGKMEQKQYQKNVIEAFRTLQNAVHRNAQEHGWWDEPREDGTCIALMHAELSECVEALRNGDPEDKHCPEFGNAVVELADVVIRAMDFCERKGWNLGAAVVAKHEVNKKREYKHGGKAF